MSGLRLPELGKDMHGRTWHSVAEGLRRELEDTLDVCMPSETYLAVADRIGDDLEPLWHELLLALQVSAQ